MQQEQERYSRARGISTDPCDLFWDDLIRMRMIQSWRSAGDKVILMIDANECIYQGRLNGNERLRHPESI